MTDAIVTDINEYRARKEGKLVNFWNNWPDERLKYRFKVLTHIENGHKDLTVGPLADMSFPEGFDPVNHMSENLSAVTTELVRRGVLVSSE